MISVVCCSREHLVFEEFAQNVAQTIGVAYEIIRVDNTANAFSSLNAAYNAGLSKALYDIVCFVHEDVAFRCTEWGQKIVQAFLDNPESGLLGICGSQLLADIPAPWWQQGNTYLNIIHTADGTTSEDQYGWKEGEQYAPMACVDGVFMVLKKSSGLSFDLRIEGFHAYDLAISMRCREAGLSILALKEITLEHFSKGNVNKSWYEAFYCFFKLYKDDLPVQYGVMMNPVQRTDAYIRFIRACLDHNLRSIAFYFWKRFFREKPISRFHLEFIKSMLR